MGSLTDDKNTKDGMMEIGICVFLEYLGRPGAVLMRDACTSLSSVISACLRFRVEHPYVRIGGMAVSSI